MALLRQYIFPGNQYFAMSRNTDIDSILKHNFELF